MPRAPGDLCGASVHPDAAGGSRFAMGCRGADGPVTNPGEVFEFANGLVVDDLFADGFD